MPSRSRRSFWRTRAWAGLSDMAGDETIGEALRQLGRAVGSLARALVGTVQRGRTSTPRREPESGPPQAWLDLVAETDPEWLARSPWVDRAARSGREGQPQRGAASLSKRPPTTERAARHASRGTEAPFRGASRTHRPTDPDAPFDGRATGEPVATGDHVRLATPRGTQPDSHDRVPAERAQARPVSAETSQQTRLVPVERVPTNPARRTTPEAQVHPTPRLLDASPSPRLSQGVQSEPERSSPHPVRHSSYSPLSARVRELPDTWPSRPAPERTSSSPEPHRPASPPSPPPSAPTWPELPLTEGLEDQNIVREPGLAAVLWDLDGRPDTLTIAQRRS